MDKKVINIVNINIKDQKEILIECIYKHEKDKNIMAILKETKPYMNIEYHTNEFSEDCNITQINIYLHKIETTNIHLQIKQDNQIFDVIYLDNKDQEITLNNNPYIIFTRKHKINIQKEGISITKRKRFELLKYEIKKQIYAVKSYKKLFLIRFLSRRKKKFYLFNDRLMYADDNAEQLFRYINQADKKMAKRCYFVLDKQSTKIKEIKKIGKVLIYKSWKHKVKYLNCRMIISSHASYYDRVYNPFDDKEMDIVKDLIHKKFVFLQHGVIASDLHKMLNRPQIIADLFITTTNKEWKDISSSKYMYNKNMVVCTGLSRFDKLKNERKKIILISPTWRSYLTDVEYGDTNKQVFENSMFYRYYKSLLENQFLIDKLKENGYTIFFLLHPVFAPYKNAFQSENNDIIKILETSDITYSQLFKECSMLITDYSSIHFDVAFLCKPILYYQFDKEEFFHSHYDSGFFSFENDGFGDVIYSEEDMVNEIINYIENDCKIKEKYEERIKNTFKYLDRNNSKRIYEAIKNLDENNEVDYRFNNVH